MKRFIVFLCLFLLNISVSHALVTISNVSYTAGSVTFTIDGDLTGYVEPGFSNRFSLVYGGDIWSGNNTSPFSSNTWSRSVFDNKVLDNAGGTGRSSSKNYTWSQYTTSLVGGTVSSATVTVSFSPSRLNVLATSPSISFYWGFNNFNPTLLTTVIPSPPPSYTVGGTVSGLNGSVTLQNNNGDDIIKTTNDGFTFPAQTEGSDYSVSVSSQPSGQSCTVGDGSGTNITANITNVTVTCVDNTYTVGGAISGLTGSVTLQNNNGDDIIKTTNDGFTFAAQTEGSDYSVSVSSQPSGQSCTVGNGSGTNITANITNVTVTCVDNTYTVGGTVSGLTGSVTLQNNNGDDIIKTTNDGFTFAAQTEGSDYSVSVSSQPSGQSCTVGDGSGTNITANITNVTVTCVVIPIPTMSVWGLGILIALMGFMGFNRRRKL